MRLLRRHHYPEVVLALLAITAIGLAVGLLIHPEAYMRRQTYSSAMGFASPQAWAIVFLVNAAMAVCAALWARSVAYWPVAGLAIVWSTWSAFLFHGALGGGISSPPVVYACLAWISLGLALVYWNDQTDSEGNRRAAS